MRHTWKVSLSILTIIVMAMIARQSGVRSLWGTDGVKGIQAAESQYEAIQSNPFVTQTVIEDAFKNYNAVCTSDGSNAAILAVDQRYPSVLLRYVRFVYGKLPDQITDISHFFEKREQKIILDAAQTRQYSESELQHLKELAHETSKPFINGNGSLWDSFFTINTISGGLFAAIAILIGAGFSSDDRRVGMDYVLASVGGRKLQRYAFRRILAGMLFLATFYAVDFALITIFFWKKKRYMYLDSPVFIVRFGSVYTDSIRSFFLKAAAGGLISIIAVYMISCFVNLCTKNSFRTMAVTGMIYFPPALLNAIKIIPAGIGRVAAIQPIMGIMYNESLVSYHVYGGLTSYEMTSVIGGTLILAVFVLIMRLEKRNTGRIKWKAG